MEGDEDLFPSVSPEEALNRKIQVVELLLDRFQEQLESADTPVKREWSLSRVRCIKKDFRDITMQIINLRKFYSERLK